MKKILLSLFATVAAFTASATDTVLWEGSQQIGWSQSCVVAASKCADMEANQQIIVYYNCLPDASYYSLGLIKGNWGDWPDKTWSTGGVSAGTTSKIFDIPEGNVATLKNEGFFLMGFGLEVTKIVWRDEVRDKSLLLNEPLEVTTDSEGVTFTYDELLAAGAVEGGGVQVTFEAAEGGYLNYMHQGTADNEYEWVEFSTPQVMEIDGVSILILNKSTLAEINTYGKTLVIQAGHVTINQIKVIQPLEVPGSTIALEENEITIMEGDTHQLVATTNPEGQKVTWTSADETIATVDYNGVVTAVGVGTTTITATAGEGSATCTVNVEQRRSITLKWVNSMNEEVFGDATEVDIYLDTYKSYKLVVTTVPEDAAITFTTTTDPAKAITWYTYPAKKEASVSVNKVGTGTCTVTMTGYPDITATATVHAVEYTEPVIEFGYYDSNSEDFSQLDALLVGSVVNLYANIYPDNELTWDYWEGDDMVWTSSNPEVASIEGEGDLKAHGILTALKAGTTTISVKIGNGEDLPYVENSLDVTVTNSGEIEYLYNFNVPNRGSSYNWRTEYGFPTDATAIEDFTFVGKTASGDPLVNLTAEAGTANPLVFTAESTLNLEVADPYVRLKSLAISASKTSVDNSKEFTVTPSEGSVEGATWTTEDENGLDAVDFLADADLNCATYVYWHVGMYRYAVPEAMSLSKESIEGYDGDTEELSFTYSPADALPGLTCTWTSADDTIASVNENGVVTLVAEGETTITAQLNAPKPVGSEEELDIKAECTVKVEKTVGLSEVSVDNNDAPAVVYDLAGVRMDASNLAPGAYIVRKGNKVSKVVIK